MGLASIRDNEMDIMEMIACPVCKGALQSKVSQQNGARGEQLFCLTCSHTYAIEDGIPDLLPPHLNGSGSMADTELSEKEVKKYYIEKERYDWVTDTKYPEKLFHILREREIVKYIKRHARGERFLDLGCGTGFITRHIDFEYVLGMDINRWAIEKARSHVPGNVRFVVGDVENIPLASNAFDMVVCTDVLEHLLNPGKALREIYRTMRDGAILIGTVPSKNPVWNFRNIITTTCPVSEPFHHNYNLVELKAMLTDFNSVKIHRGALGLEWFFTAKKSHDLAAESRN
jgi:ubiquinone/menaquinone biosynthesis C-methylase UbiE/uncharacterized protein YbaR (Trm112 family)